MLMMVIVIMIFSGKQRVSLQVVLAVSLVLRMMFLMMRMLNNTPSEI